MDFFKLSVEEYVATITFARPPANALANVVLKELSSLLDSLEDNEEVRVIVLHGEGRFFSAGADIKEFTTVETGQEFAELATYGQQLFDRIEGFKIPIIAAIHGAALGGGLELAMACHIRYVTETVKLGLPELQLGLIPGFAGTQRLPRYVGSSKAYEMLFTSEPITGVDAVQWGLASRALKDEEELMNEAKTLAAKIAKKSPITLRAGIELVNYTKQASYEEALLREAQRFGEAFVSEDGKEGIQAFIEKRTPSFKGK